MSDARFGAGDVSFAAIQEMLAPVISGARVMGVHAVRGGGISAVYRVEVATTSRQPDVIVKVYPEQFDWKMRKETYVYELLSRLASVPTPRVLASDDSQGVVPANFLVLSCLPGRMLGEVAGSCALDDLARIYEQLGRHVRSIHGLTFEQFGYLHTEVVDPHPTNADYMGFQFRKKLDEFVTLGGPPALVGPIESFVDVRREALGVCRVASLCHDDVYENNVLVDDQNGTLEMTGLLDVENAVAGDPLIDLAKTWLYSIRDNTTKWRALCRGYGDLGPLAQQRLELYRIYHTLELWDWFASIDERGPLPGLTGDLHTFLNGTALPVHPRP